MQTKPNSAAFAQNRKLYTYLPVLMLPFLTIIYWAVGIKMFYKHQIAQTQPQGLNTSLPDPNLKDETAYSKLSYYKKAADDSAKIREQLKKDPYRSGELAVLDKAPALQSIKGLGAPDGAVNRQRHITYKGRTYTGSQQTRIMQKLKTLDSVLATSSEPGFDPPAFREDKPKQATDPLKAAQIQRLETLMGNLDSQPQVDPADPELAELNGMLEKILDIQHPERVADKLRQSSSAQQSAAYPVSSSFEKTPIEAFGTFSSDSASGSPALASDVQSNGFFSLDEPVSVGVDNSIKAVVHQEQTLVTGSIIKLRLTADIYVAGTLIPKDSFVYGTVTVNGERLLVEISSIRQGSSLFPVKLSVYDLDGQPGIYIPGSISRNVAKQSVSQDIQGISLGSLDPSLGAQAASAGIQAAKTLLGKKAKLVQVSVKAGYQILLKDANLKPI